METAGPVQSAIITDNLLACQHRRIYGLACLLECVGSLWSPRVKTISSKEMQDMICHAYLSPLCPRSILVCLDLHLQALAHNILCSCVLPVLLGLSQAQAQANLDTALDGLCYPCTMITMLSLKRADTMHATHSRLEEEAYAGTLSSSEMTFDSKDTSH